MRPILLLMASIFLAASGQVLMKWGAMRATPLEREGMVPTLISLLTSPATLIGVGLYALSALLWLLAISKVDLSYAYPMVALGYVLVFVASYFFFHEPIPPLRLAGLAAIVLGVLLIARS